MATGTYSSVLDFGLNADASNGNMIVLFNPKAYIGNGNASALGSGAGLIIGSSVTNGGYGTTTNSLAAGATNPDLSANVERFRIVSAELQVYSTQAPVNIQGRCCSFLLPSDFDLPGSTTASSFAVISSLPNAVTTHLIEGGRSLYLPGGPDDLLYAPCANNYTPIKLCTVSSGAFTSWAGGAATGAPSGPTLGVAIQGAVGAANLSGRLVVNIQYIASSSNAFVNLEPVVPDPGAIGAANVLASFPRKLQGFLNTHSEQMSAAMDSLGSAFISAGLKIGTNAIASATNAMITQQLSRAGGGQRRSIM